MAGEAVPVSAGVFAVGGRRFAVRCRGRAHWDDLTRSLLAAEDGDADFELEVWDAGETGRRPERDAGEEAAYAGHAEALLYAAGGRVIRHLGPAFDLRLDLDAESGSGWVETAAAPAWLRLRPWQRVLIAALAASGAESVHAAMVARDGSGVLLPGPNGSGKSTTTFACLAAGMSLLGDDAIAVEDGRGSTIHAVAKVSEDTLARYPALEAASEPYEDPETNERALRLGGTAGPAVGSARVAAIAFPRLADSGKSRVRPLAAGQAATELWRCTLSAEAWRLGDAFSAVSALAESVPAFMLEVGRDPGGIAEAIDSLV